MANIQIPAIRYLGSFETWALMIPELFQSTSKGRLQPGTKTPLLLEISAGQFVIRPSSDSDDSEL